MKENEIFNNNFCEIGNLDILAKCADIAEAGNSLLYVLS